MNKITKSIRQLEIHRKDTGKPASKTTICAINKQKMIQNLLSPKLHTIKIGRETYKKTLKTPVIKTTKHAYQ